MLSRRRDKHLSNHLRLNYSAYLIDLDGTTYRGNVPILSAVPFIQRLLALDIPFLFLTNNATKSPGEICDHLTQVCGIRVAEDKIYTSTMALVAYLKRHEQGKKIQVIGEPALYAQVQEAGFEIVSSGQAPAEVVVQGLNRQTTYQELARAVQAILGGARFLVTNQDRLIPSEGKLFPSSGAITAFLQYATQSDPIIFGKPNAPIITGALEVLERTADQVLMIGDNYETDILAGIQSHLDTLMVLTGVTSEAMAKQVEVAPTYCVKDLREVEVVDAES